jgi:DNA mismatch endonuclease, patch repair protein
MAAIRGRNTKPEIALRSLLHRSGYRFRLHAQGIPGHPDIVFPSRRKVIFVHGCFWHGHSGCATARTPKTRREYWEQKLRANHERDVRTNMALAALGWDTLVVWECEIARHEDAVMDRVSAFLDPPSGSQ